MKHLSWALFFSVTACSEGSFESRKIKFDEEREIDAVTKASRHQSEDALEGELEEFSSEEEGGDEDDPQEIIDLRPPQEETEYDDDSEVVSQDLIEEEDHTEEEDLFEEEQSDEELLPDLGPDDRMPYLLQPFLERHILTTDTVSYSLADLGLDPDGDALSFEVLSLEHGELIISEDGLSVRYVPDGDFVGTTSLTYQLNSGELGESEEGVIDFVICKSNNGMGIWTDKNEDGSLVGEDFLGFIRNYEATDLTPAENYGYDKSVWSADLSVGPVLDDRISNIFFVNHKNGLNLYMIHNMHLGEEGLNMVKWQVVTSNNEKLDSVMVSDDGHELTQVSEDEHSRTYVGDWTYNLRTDGGVIGPISQDSANIALKYLENGNLANIAFHSSDGGSINLTSSQLGSNAFIISTKVENLSCD